MANRPSATGKINTKSGKEIAKAKLQLAQIRELIRQSEELYKQRLNEITLATQIVEQNKKDEEILAKKKTELAQLLAIKQQYESTGQSISDSDKQLLKNVQDEVAFLEAGLVLNKEIVDEKKKILDEASGITKEIENQKTKYSEVKDGIKSIKDAEKDRRTNLIKDIKEQTEYSDNLRSIGSILGKQSGLYEALASKQDSMNGTLQSAFAIIDSMGDKNEKFSQNAMEAVNGYKEFQTTIARSNKELLQGKITQEEYNKQVIQASDYFDEVIGKINTGTAEGAALANIFSKAKVETEKFAGAAKKSQAQLQLLDSAFDTFSGIPAMRELNELIKTNTANTIAFRGAMFALGAAIGAAAFDYFGAPLVVDREIKLNAKLAEFDFDQDLIKSSVLTGRNLSQELNIPAFSKGGQLFTDEDLEVGARKDNPLGIGSDIPGITEKLKGRDFLAEKIGLEVQSVESTWKNETLPKLELESKYAGRRAGIQFSEQFQQGAAQFRAGAKTARFGEQLASSGFGAGKLQLAGIDPTQISEAMSQLALETGKVPTAKIGAEMALISKRTGQSVENIASLTEYFKITDNLSQETAVNMVEGMRAMAQASNLDLGNLMAGVAEASKDALSYQIKSGEALAKQVAAAQSIGVNFNKLASAGRNMTLNYKDSIKAEMQLSAMLGRSVNLSEIRAKAMKGDYAGVMESMRAQGLNPEQMNMFEQEALQKALGGLDLVSIQKIFKGEVRTPADLAAGDAAAGGAGFLERTKQAQSRLTADQASISAKSAILSAELEKDIQKEFLTLYGQPLEAANAIIELKRKQLEKDMQTAATLVPGYAATEVEKEQTKQESGFLATITKSIPSVIAGSFSTLILQPLLGEPAKKFWGKVTGAKPTAAPAPATPGYTYVQGRGLVMKPQAAPQVTPNVAGANKGLFGMFKNMSKTNKYLAALTAVIAVGGFAFSSDAKAGERSQLPELQGETLSADQLAQQMMQTNALNKINSQMGANNDLLQNTNEELVGANKANILGGICSCIASNMQSNMGAMVDELKTLKEIYNKSYIISRENNLLASGINLDTYKNNTLTGATTGALKDSAISTAGFGMAINTATKTVIPAVKNVLAKEAVEKLPVMGFKELAKTTLKSSFGKAGIAGIAGGVVSVGGQYMKQKGIAEGDTSTYETGRAAAVLGDTASWASLGFMLAGPIGAAVVGGLGGLYSVYSNYFSDDAKKQEEAAQAAEEERLRIEGLNKQIDALLKIEESAVASAQKTMKDTEMMMQLSSDEVTWRSAMLTQTLEMTRLLSIISSDFITIGKDGVATDKQGNVVEIKDYDQLKGLKAQRGVLDFKDARQKDIAKVINQFNEGKDTDKYGKLDIGGERISLEEYKKKYKVSDREAAAAVETAKLIAGQNTGLSEKQLVGGNNNKNVTQGGTGTSSNSNNAGGKTTTNQGTGTSTNTAGGGGTGVMPTIDLSPISSQLLAMHTTLKQIEANILTQYVLQAQTYLKDEERDVAKAGVDTTTNTTLTNISTDISTIKSFMETEQAAGIGSTEIASILKQIQMEAHSRGLQMYGADVKQVNNTSTLSKEIISTKTIEQGTQTNTKQLLTLNDSLLYNMEAIQIEMVKALQDSTEILGAIAQNTAKENTTIVKLDGKAISNNVVSRQSNKTAFNRSKRLAYKK